MVSFHTETHLMQYSVLGLRFTGVVMESRSSHQSAETVTIETTIGDLIEAITDVALQAGKTEEEGYRLASFTLEKLLRDKRRKDILES